MRVTRDIHRTDKKLNRVVEVRNKIIPYMQFESRIVFFKKTVGSIRSIDQVYFNIFHEHILKFPVQISWFHN